MKSKSAWSMIHGIYPFHDDVYEIVLIPLSNIWIVRQFQKIFIVLI